MFVVTLPKSAVSDPRAFAERARDSGAQVLEIRGDLTPRVPMFDSPLPLLLSPRGTGDALTAMHRATYIDLEMGERANISPGVTRIRSFHDHEKTPTPDELTAILNGLLTSDGDIVKIATMIRTYEDVQALLALQARLPAHVRRVITGMGPKAHLLRMLSPLQNVFTYTYLEDGQHAAPGQIPLADYATVRHCQNPALFGIIGGAQISRSLSPFIHNTLNAAHNLDALFALFPAEDLPEAWEHLTALGVRGFSVTAPWKRDIVGAVDRADATVDELGAANTAVRGADGWTGYNTDVTGFQHGYDLTGRTSVAVIGSGGVVPAVILACRRKGLEDVTIYARNSGASGALHDRFGVRTAPLEDLPGSEADVIVCAVADDVPFPLPQRPGMLGIDLRYHVRTKFLQEADRLGYATADGLPMLVKQALEQFRLFHGQPPSSASVTRLRSLLSSRHGQ